eukprot:SAG11_NODE_2857_length_2901_cov_2.674875_3_plen_117_part_00
MLADVAATVGGYCCWPLLLLPPTARCMLALTVACCCYHPSASLSLSLLPLPFSAGLSFSPVSCICLPRAVLQATEEAICNALCAAETTVGLHGRAVYALPHDRLREILSKFGRLEQ